ncbi:phosphatidylinositol-specific phospholipase C1-like protein [soil metagenome]
MTSRRRIATVAATLVIAAAAGSGPATTGGADPASPSAASVDDTVRLNEVQVVGTHNSYKQMVSPPEEELLRSAIGDEADALAYEHEALPVQFQSQKVRQIELDVFLDDSGGLFAEPLLRAVAGVGPYDPRMDDPGIKVLHVQDVDYASSCLTLVECLTAVQQWSDANPSHMPITILVELKDSELDFGDFPFVVPEPWTEAAMDTLDAEIRSVMGPDDLIAPDDVRGSRSTLEEAVLADGWPTLGESRGKVLFAMDNEGGYRDRYLAGAPTLENRALFTNSTPGQPDAAVVKQNDATQEAQIQSLVADGYLVRTRADADTVEARENDTSTLDAALRSGAQFVSTDYPVPGIAFGFTTDYVAEIPGGTVARCNPVNAPPGCLSADIDTIFTPVAPPERPTEPPVEPPDGPPPGEGTDGAAAPDPQPGTGSADDSPPATEADTATGAQPVAGRPTLTG